MSDLILSVSGLRGVVGQSLTAEVATRYGSVLGSWFVERDGQRPMVVLGRDGRAGGHVIRDAVVAGLNGAGCDVMDLGVATTPTVGVMTDDLGAAGGVVITASHNPQQWNGVKWLVRDADSGESGASAPEAGAASVLRERFERMAHDAGATGGHGVAWRDLGARTTSSDGARTHVDLVRDRVGREARLAVRDAQLSVVLDSVNASGGLAGGVLRLGEADRRACVIAGSQKTLPIGILVSQATGLPFSLLPMLMFHTSQLFVDTWVADRLRRRSPEEPAIPHTTEAAERPPADQS